MEKGVLLPLASLLTTMKPTSFAYGLLQKYFYLVLCYGGDTVHNVLKQEYEEDDTYDGSVARDVIDMIHDYGRTTPHIILCSILTIPDAPRVIPSLESTMDEWIGERATSL
jgi:hypothetical protein